MKTQLLTFLQVATLLCLFALAVPRYAFGVPTESVTIAGNLDASAPITFSASGAIEQENPLYQNPIDPVEQQPVEEREISIEEFALMLQSDPELLQDISKQLGIETTDPQVVVDTVIAQMQQQIANGQN